MKKPPAPATNFYIGMKMGELTLKRRMPKRKTGSPSTRIRWKCVCSCGTEIIVPEYYMKRLAPKWHCGCQAKTLKTTHNQEYRIWLMMHQRCYNEKHEAFKHYGGRGIKIAEEWNRYTPDGERDLEIPFSRFLKHIGPRKSKKFSVDRINVDGNYEPGNVKWATAKEQRANQRSVKK